MTLPVVPVPETEKASSATLTKVKDVDKVESDEPGRPQADDFPDGGWRAWSVVFGVWVYQCCTFGYTNTFGVFNDFYVREYLHENYTSSQISWIGSVQLCLVLSSGLVAGRGFDQGYFYHLTIGGACLFVFCLFMISLTKPEQYYQIFLAQGLGLGIAIGVCYVPGLALISQYFYRRRAIAMSIAATGSAAGGALHPIMLNRLFHGSLGFHSSVRASAGMCLGLFALALPLLKPRLPPSRRHSSLLSTFHIFVRDVPYVIMTFGTTITYAGLYFPIFFVQLNAIKNGIEPKLAFYTIAILNTASILGRILPALVVPRVGVFNVVIPCLGAASILIYCTLVVNTAAGTIIFAILYGFFSGTYAGLLGPMIGSLAKSDSEIGARMGVCLAFTGIGALVGTPISGALLSTSFIWWRPIVFAGLCVSAGTLSFAVSRYLISKRNGTQRL